MGRKLQRAASDARDTAPPALVAYFEGCPSRGKWAERFLTTNIGVSPLGAREESCAPSPALTVASYGFVDRVSRVWRKSERGGFDDIRLFLRMLVCWRVLLYSRVLLQIVIIDVITLLAYNFYVVCDFRRL